MEKRVELNEMDLENVVGGSFNYHYNEDGSMYCQVDGAGTYDCSSDAKDKISVYILTHKGCTLDDVIDYAFSNGLFW